MSLSELRCDIPFLYTNNNSEAFITIAEKLVAYTNSSKSEIFCSLLQWYWRGDFDDGIETKSSRFFLLKLLHDQEYFSKDFIFAYENEPPPRKIEKLLDGSYEFDIRAMLKVPGKDTKNWRIDGCQDAFKVLSDPIYDGKYPYYSSNSILDTTLRGICLPENLFQKFILKEKINSVIEPNHEKIIKYILKNFNGEKNFFDLKSQFGTYIDMLHDILSLSNVVLDRITNRYLIYGVNDSGITVGINRHSENSLCNHKIMDFVRSRKFNKMPNIETGTFRLEANTIYFICIRDSQEKPYFLYESYRQNGKEITVGTIYTRNGSTNTPINCSSTDSQIEAMFIERLNHKGFLNKSPMTAKLGWI